MKISPSYGNPRKFLALLYGIRDAVFVKMKQDECHRGSDVILVQYFKSG